MFLANVHSNWKINTQPLRSEESASKLDMICRRILAAGADDRVVSIVRIEEGLLSENYRIDRESPERGKYSVLLRLCKDRTTRTELHRIGRLMNHLSGRDGFYVPCVYNDPDLHDENAGLWQCSPFIEGNHFCGTESELRDAAVAIRGLHETLREYEDADSFPQKSYGSIDAQEWDDALLAIQGSDVADLVESNRERLWSLLFQQADFAEKNRGTATLDTQLVHADLHPQNLIMREGAAPAIIDFGNVCIGTTGLDIGNACHRLVRQYVVSQAETEGIPWQRSLPIGLEAFLSAYGSVDRKTLPVFMQEILLRKIGAVILVEYPQNLLSSKVSIEQIERFVSFLDEVEEMGKLL